MKTFPLFLALALVLSAPVFVGATTADVEVHFSPAGDCTETIVKELGKAKKTVFVQAYSFTSAPIAKALVDAHKRGVHVEVILDKGQRTEKYSSADFVSRARIQTFIDARHAIAHNKIMVIDEKVTLTGSFNFTKAAEEKNAENLVVIRSSELAAQYLENWKTHVEHSEPYESVRSMDQIPKPKRPGE
jgi:phosphatidylserine/phosphatidylglycerophosphate/cardiolipin synthase-like enzyme